MENKKHLSKRARKRRQERIMRVSLVLICFIAILALIIFGVSSCVSSLFGKEKSVSTASSGQVQETSDKEEETQEPEPEKIKIEYPIKSDSYKEVAVDTVKSPYVVFINTENNEVIAGRNYDTRIYPASMTKVMTLIVAVEHLDNLDSTFTMTNEIIDPLVKQSASRAGFDANEVVSAKDLLYGLILPSGADSSVALADMISGSEEEFVKLMNEKCQEMGLKNTHFMNTSGLYDENHYTTAEEMAMILEYAMQNETCAQILSTYQYTTAKTEQHPDGILLTSTMFSRMYGNEVEGALITAGKTGYTVEAMHCLVSYGEKSGKHYVAVTAGASGRWDVIYDDFELFRNYTLVEETATDTQTENQTTQPQLE